MTRSIRFGSRPAGLRVSGAPSTSRACPELEKLGLMRPAGRAAFAKRDDKKSRIYSYEQRFHAKLEPHHRQALEANPPAWAFFQAQPPWFQRQVTYWIVSAKTEETRLRRLQKLIDDAARGRRL